MTTEAEQFVKYLTHTISREPDAIFAIETETAAWGMVHGILFYQYPEPELTTGFTYGLSAGQHPDWRDAKPELSITTESTDTDWTQAIAYLVEWNRTTHSFLPGSLFHYGRAVSPNSAMDSFLVFNLAIGRGNEFQNIPLGRDKITVYGVHPLHHGEVGMLQKVGIRKFMELPEYQLFSTSRPDLSKLYKLNS